MTRHESGTRGPGGARLTWTLEHHRRRLTTTVRDVADDRAPMLVGAFVLDYEGLRFRCFGDPPDALDWLGKAPSA